MSLASVSQPSEGHVSLFTPKRRREAARIVVVGILTLLYWRSVVPFSILLGALVIGLYPLAKTGLLDLWHERKIGTELFVTIATLIAVTGGEYVAGSVLMTIILIAEYIADLNTDRARASIKALIGAAPRMATIRTPDGERIVPIGELTAGAIVLAPALARADVGIAMGARGTQAAIEAADVALMTDDLRRIVTARLLARRAYRTIQENLIFGVGVVHILGITAALQGWIGPIQAALLHLGPDVLVFFNSVKLLRVRLESIG